MPKPKPRRPTATQQAAKQQAAKQRVPKEQAAKQQAAKQRAPKEQTAKQQAAKQRVPKEQAAKQQAVTQQTAKQQAAKQQAVTQQTAKQQAVTQQTAKQQAAKQQAVTQQTAKQRVPKEQAAKQQAAKQQAATRRAAKEPGKPRMRLEVDERRAQLVELGLREFGARTYDEVSIDELAQMAGISKGLLYHYFPTKRAFYLACVRAAAARLVAQMDDMPRDLPPLERLHVGLDRYLAYVRAHGRAYATLMRGGVGVDRELTAVVDETRSALLAQLTNGMAHTFPSASLALASPLLQIALHGWIGLAEAASLAWVEACVDGEREGVPSTLPTASAVRDLLVQTLVAIVQGATQTQTQV